MSAKQWMRSDEKAGAKPRPSKSAAHVLHGIGGQQRNADTLVARAAVDPGSLTQGDMLQLQRTIGNQSTRRLLSREVLGGLKPNAEADEGIGGRTFGEAIGDVGRPVGTAVGNVVGSVAGALTGTSISSNTNAGPNWNNHGDFVWQVGFNTTARNGWIVQEINNTMRADTAAGAPAPGWRPTPQYWEAWAVDGAGNVTPNIGPDNDYWTRPSKGAGTEGHWSMSGSVYFTTTDPATTGFAVGTVGDAGILLSATAAPAGLGIARLHRYAQGTWDSTGVAPTHTGSAGP